MTAKQSAPFVALAAILFFGTTPALAADVFAIGTGNGNAGSTGVEVPVTAQHDQPMQGFSLSISFDSTLLSMTGVTFNGTETEAVSPNGTPDYAQSIIDNVAGTVVTGVIFGFNPVPPLNQLPQIPASPDTPNLIANLVFDISPGALPISIPVQFQDGLGSPPVDNVYSNDGVSFPPAQLLDGEVSVNNLHRFYFDPLPTVPGGSVGAVVRYDHEDPMAGFVISLTWDSAKLTLQPPSTSEGWWAATDLQIALAPDTIEFFDVKTVPAIPVPGQGYLALIAQFDFTGPFNGQVVPVGTHQSLVRVNYTVANNPGLIGQTTIIAFTNDVAPASSPDVPTANLVVTDTAAGIPPIQDDGIVQIIDAPSFNRGNANNDSAVNLADAIFLLQYLFTSGPAPGCFDAADVTDDGQIDISDAVRVINYLFVDGAPPEAPFPGCGLDGTPDTFDCAVSPASCP